MGEDNKEILSFTGDIPSKDIKYSPLMNDLGRCTKEQIGGILKFFFGNRYSFSHHHPEFYRDFGNFLTLQPKEMEKFSHIYIKCCEDIITYLYTGTACNGKFSLVSNAIIDHTNTIKDIFDEGFINMLKSLLKKRWTYEFDESQEQSKISINGMDISDENFKNLEDTGIYTQKIEIEKIYLNAFLILFLRNSFENPSSGHKVFDETKNVSIEIGNGFIRMTDVPIREFLSEEGKIERANSFKKEDILDGPMNFKNRTIRTFYEMIKMLNEHGYNYKFDCGFNDDLNFFLELKF